MKMLLFGSSGMVGTATELACLEKGVDYIGMSHSDIDITEPSEVEAAIDRIRPDVVVNSVAMVGIDQCEDDPGLAFQVNSTAVARMAQACDQRDTHFVQFSTHAVFDGQKVEPYTEDDPVRVMSIYAGSKFLAECFAMNLCRNCYVLRLPTMFGPRRNYRPGFVDKMMERIRNGQDLRVADDRIDSLTYTMDVGRRLITMLQEGVPPGLYHIANSEPTSYYNFICTLVEYLGAPVKVSPAKDADFPATGFKPLRTGLLSRKLVPERSWKESLKEYVDIYAAINS